MDETTFRRLAGQARTLAAISTTSPLEEAYWCGYARGVRRAYHGEAFGTCQEHAAWLALAGDQDPSRDARGRGYRDGLEGKEVHRG